MAFNGSLLGSGSGGTGGGAAPVELPLSGPDDPQGVYGSVHVGPSGAQYIKGTPDPVGDPDTLKWSKDGAFDWVIYE